MRRAFNFTVRDRPRQRAGVPNWLIEEGDAALEALVDAYMAAEPGEGYAALVALEEALWRHRGRLLLAGPWVVWINKRSGDRDDVVEVIKRSEPLPFRGSKSDVYGALGAA